MYRLGVWNVWEIRYEQVFNSRIFLEPWSVVVSWRKNRHVIALILHIVKYKVLYNCTGSTFGILLPLQHIA